MKIAILDDWNHFYDDQPAMSRLRELGEVKVWYDKAASDDELAERLQGVSIVGANRERTRFPASVLESLSDVELISQSGGAGRHIDIDVATQLGIAIAAGGGAANGSAAVAELGLGLLISLTRSIPSNDRRIRTGDWNAPISDVLFGKTLGVIGLGKIGVHMAKVCQALGLPTIAGGPTLTAERAAESSVEYVAFDDLFPRADVLFISPILSDLTRGIVGPSQLGAMKPTSYLINISRGPVGQEAALIEALRQKKIRGAGLDVFDQEPLPDGHPLLELDNVVLTPHIGWVTQAHFAAFANAVMTNAINYIEGNPSGIVNEDALKVKRGTRA